MKCGRPVDEHTIHTPPTGRWYKCKGCGEPCAIFDNGQGAHGKPNELLGVPDSVPCDLWRRCNTRAFFEQHVAGEALPNPTEYRSVDEN